MMTQDFPGGGALYQIGLKSVVRCIMEPPLVLGDTDKRIAKLRRHHDISGILDEIERENTSGLSSLRSNLTFRPRKCTLKSINRRTVEARTSEKARGRAKKRRRAS